MGVEKINVWQKMKKEILNLLEDILEVSNVGVEETVKDFSTYLTLSTIVYQMKNKTFDERLQYIKNSLYDKYGVKR